MAMTLVIGDFNKSSWSMRAWLVLRAANIPFETRQVLLERDDTRSKILALSPSGKVPVLKVGGLLINDSLAIAEYLAERHPEANLWPTDPDLRALARAAAAEMHAGFVALRTQMPFGLVSGEQAEPLLEDTRTDIRRIFAIWEHLRALSGQGTYLCGEHFGIVDAMYVPVLLRLRRFDIPLPPALHGYAKAVFAHPPIREWLQLATEQP